MTWVRHRVQGPLPEWCQGLPLTPVPPTAGSLVQELIRLLGESRRLTRAALHLLLLPHLRQLSLRPCPGLASNAIARLVTLRCKVSAGGPRHGDGGAGLGVPPLWGWGSRAGGDPAVGLGQRSWG